MSFIFQAKGGKPNFLSEYNRDRFLHELKQNEGRKYRIKPVSAKVSDNRRGWYFGAIIPLLQSLNDEWKNLTSDQMHEVMKAEFNGFEYIGIDGNKKTTGQSVANSESDTEEFDNFILRIGSWVLDNYGLTLPDPEAYKNKRDGKDDNVGEIEYPTEEIGTPKF